MKTMKTEETNHEDGGKMNTPTQTPQPDNQQPKRSFTPLQKYLTGLVIALAGSTILLRLTKFSGVSHTAVLFVGIPAFLAIVLVMFTPPAKSSMGQVMKGITLALLMASTVLVESMVCLLMSAPLFYLVGIVVVLISNAIRKHSQNNSKRYSVLILIFSLLSFEGVFDSLTLPRAQTVEVAQVLDLTPDEIQYRLAQTPQWTQPLPWLFHFGFPQPIESMGKGLEIGDTRLITMRRKKALWKPGHHIKTLSLIVSEKGDEHIVFKTQENNTKIKSWMNWQDSTLKWKEIHPGQTQVTWTFRYQRLLDPSWYFGPLERYAMKKAGEYLTANLFQGM